ncbi:MAG: ROK family protein, partial [Sedimentisphaerales bacterium]|nr:ROK family protein [Sedimentisphaerales bacterium]
RRGAAVGATDFISILLRYGIGACLYVNGAAMVEQKLGTGELGHMRLNLDGPACICGQKGCLDVYASGRTWPGHDGMSQDDLIRTLESRARYISIALANLLKLVHPPLIIINGMYNDYEPIVRPVLAEILEEELKWLKLPVPRIVFGEPVELKTSIGAAMRAADAFLENHLSRQVVAV